ncbi:hypothetical protein J2X65_004247 [Ancylobacter sp. 3268]|uniref:polysaccharide pyruvyl transferase family protein n=1 Tax=Ancylobacter sp. 3268 TaxID=2817752 RepID=UPI00286214BD|nr:polysaccharide pyruvyl transferase family protein [Ancylobacter sp. 3268]MDR6954871.1 hypothetical protein [Ancylobacter sp. 3268]
MLEEYSNRIEIFLRAAGLQPHLVKVWTYDNACLVADLNYKGVRFGFDFTPSENGLLTLDISPRRYKSAFRVTANGRKKRLAQGVSLDRALKVARTKTRQLISEIDGYIESRRSLSAVANAPQLSARAEAAPKPSKPLKVGVLTLPPRTNFGGALQAHAVMEVLRRLGHAPVLINRQHPAPDTDPDAAGSAQDAEIPLLTTSFAAGKKAPTFLFTEKYTSPITRPFYSPAQLSRNVGRYDFDAIVVGSDQVWRPQYARNILSDFFCGFLPEDDSRTKRISYAASFGAPDWEFDAEQTRMAAHLIKKFDAVSVREDGAVELCRNHLGVDAQHVLDPTLLLPADHYAKLCLPKQLSSNSGQVTAYILDTSSDKTRVINAVSRKLSVKAYSTDGLRYTAKAPANDAKADMTVEGWLAAFHKAAFVVTDSFHGCVFSILFNKPFIAYGNPARGMARFTSLLKMFGLEDRLVVKSSEIDLDQMLQPIDWNAVNGRLEKLRGQSLGFLIAALGDDDKATERPLLAGASA